MHPAKELSSRAAAWSEIRRMMLFFPELNRSLQLLWVTLVLPFLSGPCMDHLMSSQYRKGEGERTLATLILPLRLSHS